MHHQGDITGAVQSSGSGLDISPLTRLIILVSIGIIFVIVYYLIKKKF